MEAQCFLAWMYLDGEGGLDKDYNKARQLMQKSAEQGLAVAQSWLGTHYVRAEQYKESLYWFTKAAEQGYADAQYRLGLQLLVSGKTFYVQ